jgi:hypothetical protein
MVIDSKRVANICDETFMMYKYGGSLIRRDDESFLLTDVACVTCSQIQYMQTCLPHLKVQVLSSEASTSGFVLMMSVSTQHTDAIARSCVHVGMQLIFFLLFFIFICHKHMQYLQTMPLL